MTTSMPETDFPDHWAGAGRNLLRVGAAAVAAADPAQAVAAALPAPPATGRVAVLAIGKAAIPMARAVESAWGDLGGRLCGVAVTNDASTADLGVIEAIEAAHPTPDARSAAAAERLLALAGPLGPEDLALALISGGGSALVAAPIDGLSLAQKQAVNTALLASGASIHEINTVRKRLSAIKGGRLARAIHPARLVTLAISDVPGDDPAVIASGPTAADGSTTAEAEAIIARYGLPIPDGTALAETPKPGDPVFEGAAYRIIASPAQSVAAAITAAEGLGWEARLIGETVEGEARSVAAAHAALARELADGLAPGARPLALISGGELTVTLTGQGRGGPNREYVLALAIALAGDPRIAAFAMDTDGADGAPGPDGAPVAGALAFPDTAARAAAMGLDLAAALADNDAGGAFDRLGDALRTGYTGTNVNDVRVLLITPA